MSEVQRTNRGWFARWLEHRRIKRQRAIARKYFARERARASGRTYPTPSAYQHHATGASWFGFGGGDGGGCGGDGGGC